MKIINLIRSLIYDWNELFFLVWIHAIISFDDDQTFFIDIPWDKLLLYLFWISKCFTISLESVNSLIRLLIYGNCENSIGSVWVESMEIIISWKYLLLFQECRCCNLQSGSVKFFWAKGTANYYSQSSPTQTSYWIVFYEDHQTSTRLSYDCEPSTNQVGGSSTQWFWIVVGVALWILFARVWDQFVHHPLCCPLLQLI